MATVAEQLECSRVWTAGEERLLLPAEAIAMSLLAADTNLMWLTELAELLCLSPEGRKSLTGLLADDAIKTAGPALLVQPIPAGSLDKKHLADVIGLTGVSAYDKEFVAAGGNVSTLITAAATFDDVPRVNALSSEKGFSWQTAFSAACLAGAEHIADHILARPALVSSIGKLDPFLPAAAAGGSLKLTKYLLEHGADIEFSDSEKRTALTAACTHTYGYGVWSARRAVVEHLLEKKASTAGHKEGTSPLMASVVSGRSDLVEILLKAGADPER